MNLPSHFASCGSKALFRVLIPLLTLALAAPLAAADSASAAPGVIVGNVISKATNNGLIGAKVEIPALNVTTFVDSTGRYRLSAAPGTHDLVVTYTGLDSQTVLSLPVQVLVAAPKAQLSLFAEAPSESNARIGSRATASESETCT
jgi:hypothetical protein